MPVKPKIQNTDFNILRYIIRFQIYTHALNYFHTICINYLTNFLYVFKLQYTLVYGFCYPFLSSNVNNTYKYLPCCSNKYIFLIGKNKFEKPDRSEF